jgi:DNA replication protein DnaC
VLRSLHAPEVRRSRWRRSQRAAVRGRYLDGGYGVGKTHLLASLWHDALTGRSLDGGAVRLADLLTPMPVALLVRHEAATAAISR